MRTEHLKKHLSASLAVLLLAAAAVFPASANSAIRDWAGTDGIGPLLTGGGGCPGGCPIEVTHESLVLTLDTLPARQDNAGYTARVTAASRAAKRFSTTSFRAGLKNSAVSVSAGGAYDPAIHSAAIRIVAIIIFCSLLCLRLTPNPCS